MPKEAWNPECLVPTVKHRGRSVVIWAVISWYCAGPIITLNGQITASDYMDILGNQVHAMVQMLFPDNDAVFQDDSLPIHTARIVHSWIGSMKVAVSKGYFIVIFNFITMWLYVYSIEMYCP
jgi:hypothetical protein